MQYGNTERNERFRQNGEVARMQRWKVPMQIAVGVLLVAMTVAVLLTTPLNSIAAKGALAGIAMGFAGLIFGVYYDRKQAAARPREE
ncbi:hypothetical protein E4198_20505 [Streptomyces sp. RKND-216]|uniref:hypothetical protein n=1 Tax=Streptomyces sp. RKND-216 TaxID=2562581 RepID=UPI00109DF4B3|nr:hypothetical protein [Streptomyces sp. RKND-216]THA26732.1 hypothetical protein E4198_20505 [Streptomyces sp. RKND-216]